MSADDWLPCPVCRGLPIPLRDGYKQFYGKIPEEEYNSLKNQTELALKSTPVRVDYEYGLNADGTISLNFFAGCDLCHAKWKHMGVVK